MHPRKRKIVIALLAAGTILGFGQGFASMRGRACARRDAFEQRVAEVCVDAARRDQEAEPQAGDPPDRLERRHHGKGSRHEGRPRSEHAD